MKAMEKAEQGSVTHAQEGEAVWLLGALMELRLNGEQTGGRLSLSEHHLPHGPASPLHAQPNEDETFYVLDGDLRYWIDGRWHAATVGSVVFVPRGTPHAFRVDSQTARVLVINNPAGHERFFRAAGAPAQERRLPDPPAGPPDMAALGAAAADAGFEILGPPPEA